MFYTRAFADNYRRMNDAACVIATMLESEGFPSLAVPAYSPLKFYRGEPCGMISFKHAAAEAGIGKLGKNTIFVHPEYGNILRLGGFITTAELPTGRPKEYKNICPPSCNLCEKACPVGALSDGEINIGSVSGKDINFRAADISKLYLPSHL
jgi:epoxyqueuosine reductase